MHTVANSNNVKQPTCGQDGTVINYCPVCTYGTLVDTIPATGEHTYGEDDVCTTCGAEKPAEHVHSYAESVTAPTCTEAGYTTYTCACGDSYKDNEVAATGHEYTYTDNGDNHTVGCENCNLNETADHAYTDGKCICGAEEEVGPTEPVINKNLAFNGISLALDSALAMNWTFASSLVEGATDYYVVFTKAEGNGLTEPLVVTVGKDDMVPLYNNGVLYKYQVVFDKIAACEMGENIVAKLYVEKDGVLYVSREEGYTYSVLAYCKSQISTYNNQTTDKAIKTMRLMIECLNYGAAAQERFGYKTGELVNASVTAEQQEKYGLGDIAYTFDGTLDKTTGNAVAFSAFALNLEERIKYIMSYTLGTEDAATLTAVVKDANGAIVQVIQGTEFVANGSKHEVHITIINAPNLRDNYSVAIYSGYVDESNIGTVISPTLTVSVEDYVANAKAIDKAVTVAALRYGDAAAAYFA